MRQGFLTPGGLSLGLIQNLSESSKKSRIHPQVRRGINSPSHSESRLKPTAKPRLNHREFQSSLRGLSL